MPEYLAPGVYIEEVATGVKPISGVSTSTAALESIAADFRRTMATHAPEWTNYNESDPGVTLIEIFAFLSENLLYRASEIPERGSVAARRAAAALAALGHAERECGGLRRPTYFSGQLLDAETFTAEQDYHREKLRRHNRGLHGYGVVSGLAVREPVTGAGASVVVEPGCAIDLLGEQVCVPCAVTMTPRVTGDSVFVTLRFWERVCRSAPAEGELSARPASVEEACLLGFSPAVVDPAIPLARLLRANGIWRVDPIFAAPRVGIS